MPGWVKKAITKRTVLVTSGTPVTIESDPAQMTEIAAADEQRGFLNIDSLPLNLVMTVFRYEGARPDALQALDTTAVLTVTGPFSGVTSFSWSAPAGAARKTRIVLHSTAGTVASELLGWHVAVLLRGSMWLLVVFLSCEYQPQPVSGLDHVDGCSAASTRLLASTDGRRNQWLALGISSDGGGGELLDGDWVGVMIEAGVEPCSPTFEGFGDGVDHLWNSDGGSWSVAAPHNGTVVTQNCNAEAGARVYFFGIDDVVLRPHTGDGESFRVAHWRSGGILASCSSLSWGYHVADSADTADTAP